jgi:hypothetical protein
MIVDFAEDSSLTSGCTPPSHRTVASNDEFAQRMCDEFAHPDFEGKDPCPLRGSAYVQRILKYTECSPWYKCIHVIKEVAKDGSTHH